MKTILYFLSPYKKLCAFTLLAMILDVAGALLIPRLTADMINIGVTSGNMNYIFQKGLLMILISLAAGGSAILGSYFCARLSANMGKDMRNALYDKSLSFSARDFEQFTTGSMITRTLSDVNVVQQAVVWCIQMVLPVPVMCVLGIIMAFSTDLGMGLLLLGVTALVLALAALVTKKAAFIFQRLQWFLDQMNTVVRESLTGVRVIRAFNKEPFQEQRMRKTFQDYARSAISVNRLFAGLDCFAFLAINFSVVGIIWLGGNRVGQGHMQIGDITAVTEYAILILFYILMAQMVILLLPRAHVCLGRIQAVLHQEPEILDPSQALREPFSQDPREPVAVFEEVSLRFPQADGDTLSHLSFACRRGETTAIIGGTGSGKSTIGKLLLRFLDPTQGRILFRGVPLTQLTQKQLRRRIAYVPQKAWLFSGTIADNLRHGNPRASREEMERALAVSQSHFVNSLPQGLQSPVSQGGANFSGGQKQRLSIARALMKKADLYIFDDSFSALDFKTDAALRKALAKELPFAAVLIIAQRISTIQNASCIIVLDQGRIAGIGTHSQLMESCEIYRDILRSQTKGGENRHVGNRI